MKFDELLDTVSEPRSAEDILAGIRLAEQADDLDARDKAGFATGVLMGMTYVLASESEQGNSAQAAHTLLHLIQEWEANGVL